MLVSGVNVSSRIHEICMTAMMDAFPLFILVLIKNAMKSYK